MLLRSKALTVCNSRNINKPNEDFYLCDDLHGIYIVVDGVSRDKINGIYPLPSPSKIVSEVFVDIVYDFICKGLNSNDAENIGQLLTNAIRAGNEEINKYNNRFIWEENFLPGTVGIISVVYRKRYYYAYIGDCIGLLLNGKKSFFTASQTHNISIHKHEYTAKEIRNTICNNRLHKYGYGVLNGDEKALDFVVSGQLELSGIQKIFLGTDGISSKLLKLDAKELSVLSVNDIMNMDESQYNTDDKTLIEVEVSV